MDVRGSTRSVLQRVGAAPSIRGGREEDQDQEDSRDCDQDTVSINTPKSNMNMKQEGPFLGEISQIIYYRFSHISHGSGRGTLCSDLTLRS